MNISKCREVKRSFECQFTFALHAFRAMPVHGAVEFALMHGLRVLAVQCLVVPVVHKVLEA